MNSIVYSVSCILVMQKAAVNFVTKFVKPLHNHHNPNNIHLKYIACVGAGTLFSYGFYKWHASDSGKKTIIRPLLQRFTEFGSLECDKQVYMTARDFLESVLQPTPRFRLTRQFLQKERILNNKHHKASCKMHFRDMADDCILTYVDYVFLLSVLMQPRNALKIYFGILDRDGSGKVAKDEFALLTTVIYRTAEAKQENVMQSDSILLTHFFGRDGKGYLSYSEFDLFVQNLKTEIIELEFTELSRGLPTVSEIDFAILLLKYSCISQNDYNCFLKRFLKLKPNGSISFKEYCTFCHFLDNIADFEVAVRMFSLAGQPVCKQDFRKAVRICAEVDLTNNLVDVIFALFDADDDGHLVYEEFLGKMKQWRQRKLNFWKETGSWNHFKKCVAHEIKQAVYYKS